jgi:hypothetical protein
VSDVNGRKARGSYDRLAVGGIVALVDRAKVRSQVPRANRIKGHGRRAVKLQMKIASAAEAARDRCGSTLFRWPSLAVVVIVVGSVRRDVAGRRFEHGRGTRNTSSAKRSFVETW